MKDILLPELGEDVMEATVSFWHHQEGEKVNKDEDLVEFYTDKANFSVKAPSGGILQTISVKEGQKAEVGQIIGTIEEE